MITLNEVEAKNESLHKRLEELKEEKTHLLEVNKIFEYHYEHIPFALIQKELPNFRIVRYSNGSDQNWYLLKKESIVGSILKKTNFFCFRRIKAERVIKTNWYVVNRGECHTGCHSSVIGEAQTSCNGIYHIIHSIPDFLRLYLGNKQTIPFHREGLPNGELLCELDIAATINNYKHLVDNNTIEMFQYLLNNSVAKKGDSNE